MLSTAHRIAEWRKSTIPTKAAAKLLKVSYAKLKEHIDFDKNQGVIRYQARIEDEDESRPILGFEVDYLKEVNSILGPDRGPGIRVFTPENIEKLRKFNQNWKNRFKT